VLAVDGGNSKTDIVLLAADGSVLGATREPTTSHQQVGLHEAAARLAAASRDLAGRSGLDADPGQPVADVAVLCIAGTDLPSDERALARAHAGLAPAGMLVVHNDVHAILRAGSPAGWGVGMVLGAGINAIGVSPSGREARFAALGEISGDRGGGGGLAMWALGAAVRAQDGRGPRTSLERLVPAAFGLRRPLDVTLALYTERLRHDAIRDLARVAVQAAEAGDAVAHGLVDDVADEAVLFVTAAIRRLRMTRIAVPVVVGGGLAVGAWRLFEPRMTASIRATAPAATISLLSSPPVLGAALLGLDRIRPGDEAAADSARRALRERNGSSATAGRPPALMA
jgi:N-acetylglucosamine kinase-like BadF-type ATPase